MVTIACVHSGASANIFGIIESALKKEMKVPYVVQHFTNPQTINIVAQNDKVTPEAAKFVLNAYMASINEGANIILNMCSSVGEVADNAEKLLDIAGIKLVRIDKRMCEEAVKKYDRIAVVATLHSTLKPSCDLVKKCAVDIGKKVEISEVLINGAFMLDDSKLSDRILNELSPVLNNVDTVIFAQASMQGCKDVVEEKIKKEVFTSPEYAAKEVAEVALNL